MRYARELELKMPNHCLATAALRRGRGALSYLKRKNAAGRLSDVVRTLLRSAEENLFRRILGCFLGHFWAALRRASLFCPGKSQWRACCMATATVVWDARRASARNKRARVRTSRRWPILEIRVFQPRIPANLVLI